jgi:hypothetical protein
MDDLELIKSIRSVCGDFDTDNYYVEVENANVPVFIGVDHEAVFPQVIIRPFIGSSIAAQTTIYCGEGEDQVRSELKYKYADFQIDVFSKDLIELVKVKQAIESRIDDFNDVDVIVYSDPTGWQAYDPSTYVNDDYTSERDILKLVDPLATLTKATSVAEVLATNGSWFLDDSGLYVNPLIDLDSIEIYEIIDGRGFSDGTLLYERGINGIRITESRKTKDKVPKVDRWTIEVTITYREITPRKIGTLIEEMDVNVQKT